MKLSGKDTNEKEKQIYMAVAQHILDRIEKGINDNGIKNASKNNRF